MAGGSSRCRNGASVCPNPNLGVPCMHSELWAHCLITSVGSCQRSMWAVSPAFSSWSRPGMAGAPASLPLQNPGDEHCCCPPFPSLLNSQEEKGGDKWWQQHKSSAKNSHVTQLKGGMTIPPHPLLALPRPEGQPHHHIQDLHLKTSVSGAFKISSLGLPQGILSALFWEQIPMKQSGMGRPNYLNKAPCCCSIDLAWNGLTVEWILREFNSQSQNKFYLVHASFSDIHNLAIIG